MRNKSSLYTTIFFTIVLLVGLSVMLYPIVSNWWNERVQSHAVASYNDAIVQMDEDKTEELLDAAYAYNRKIANLNAPFSDYVKIAGYDEILDVSGTGIMGYITIPAIGVELPIYHGTSEAVLNVAAGHLQGSAIPVGGENTHAVISAHRGLPSAKLFTDLDKMVVGDVFTITILDEVYTYQVEEILIVQPYEMNRLAIIPDRDYVTLMTCTPYGVNTHRLLLRSKRIETIYELDVKVVADALKVDPLYVVPLIAAPLLLALLIFWIFGGKRKKKRSSLEYMIYLK